MDCPWAGFAPATMRFCEENLCAWIRQPANAWTNLAYLAAGLFILLHLARHPRRGPFVILAPIAAAVGITSFLYHASGAFFFQVFDLASMFLFSAFLLAANITRLTDRPRLFYPLFVGVFAATLAALLLVRGQSGAVLFIIEVAAAISLEIALVLRHRPAPNYRPYLLALGFYAVAQFVWILDFTRLWCVPGNHLLPGHALWHLLNAPSFVFIYFFYRGMAAPMNTSNGRSADQTT
jgi:hypothetical protein